MNQQEFNQFYDKLKRYADQKARRLFYDTALRQEVVDKALDKVIDEMISGREMNITFMKYVINFSIRDSHRSRKIEPVSLKEIDSPFGFRGRKLKD